MLRINFSRKDILDTFKDCDFSGEITEETIENKIFNQLPKSFRFDYNTGASKLVIYPLDCDFVIKIPFNGQSDYNWNDQYQDYLDYCFEENSNAWDDDIHYWDYCFTELMLYRYAKKAHVNYAFCKTTLIGNIDDYPIYIQQKIETYNDRFPNDEIQTSYHSNELIQQMKKSTSEVGVNVWNTNWQADAYKYYGEKQYKKIMQFIWDYEIEDLHSENVGYLGDKPVIIDYASWRQ